MNLCQYLRVKSSILAPCAGVERRETNVRPRPAGRRRPTAQTVNRGRIGDRPSRRNETLKATPAEYATRLGGRGRPSTRTSPAHVSSGRRTIRPYSIEERSDRSSSLIGLHLRSLLTLRASLVSRSPDTSPLADSSSPRLIYTPSTRNGITQRESRGLEAPRARLAPSPRAAVSRDAAGGGAWGAGARLTAGPPASQQHG